MRPPMVFLGFGHLIIYRWGIFPKIQRSFAVFSPCDFIARPPAGPGILRCGARPTP
jgi:hypothetical protein